MSEVLFPRGRVLELASQKSEVSTIHRTNSQNLFTSTHKTDEIKEEKKGGKVRSSSAKRSRTASATQSITSSHAPYTGMRKAEELTGKRLRVGLHVLARVRRITSKQIVLSLPSGFTGYCRANDINDEIATALQRESLDENEDMKEDSTQDSTTLSSRLSKYFTPGQYVFATISHVASGTADETIVVTGGGSSDESKRRRIYVSLRPDAFNAGVSFSSLKMGTLVYGFIRSHQDHGYIIATGIDGVSTTFLPFSACDGTNGLAGVEMQKDAPPGFPVLCTVSAINRGSRSVTLACNSLNISSSVSKDSLHTIYTVKPGMLFDCTIDRTLPNGLAVSFLQYFRGSISLAHLSNPATQFWSSRYKSGDVVSARVLFIDPLEKIIALSIAPHIVKLGVQMPSLNSSFGVGGPDYKDLVEGNFVDEARVVRIDPGSGVLVAWGSVSDNIVDKKPLKSSSSSNLEAQLDIVSQWGRSAYVHISRVADKKVESLEKMFKVGSIHRIRLLGFSGIEGMAQGSMRPSVLNATVMRASDVKVGDIVEGTVSRVFIDRPDDPTSSDRAAALAAGKGAVATIKIGEGVSGTIFALHVADVLPVRSFQTLKLRKRFFESLGLVEGQKQRCRVLTIDKNSGRIQLTLKKSLVQAASVITSFESAAHLLAELKESNEKAALVATGFITGLREAGIIVTFCGDAHGFVPAVDLIAAGVISAEEAVISSHDGKEYTTIPSGILSTAYSLGQVIKVRIISVNLKKPSMRLSVTLSETKKEVVDDVQDLLESADILTSKTLIPEADLPSPGDIVDGIVERFDAGERIILRIVTVRPSIKAPKGLFAELLLTQTTDNISLISNLTSSNSFTQPGAAFKGLLVLSHLKAKEHGSPQISVSGKPLLLLASRREGMLPISIETAESGQLVAGSVASVTAFGAFIRFLDGVTALAPRTRWPKIYQEDSGPFEIKKGQSILAVVNRVTKAEEGTESKSRVTVSLQPEAVARSLPSSYFLKVNDESEVGTLSAFCSRPTGASVPHVSDAATYLRGILFDEEFALCSTPVRSVVDEDNDDVKTSDIEAIPCRFIYRPGAITKARITSITDQGILLEFPSPTMRLLKQGLGHLSNDQNEKLPSVMGFAISPQQQSTFIEGAIVDVRILDVDAEKSVIVAELLSLTTPKQKKPKRGDLSSPVADELVSRLDAPLLPLAITSLPDVGSIVTARVLQYRKTSNYAVVLLEGSNALAFAATSDFILSSDTLILQEGQNISVVITQVPSSNTTGSTFSSKRKQQVVSTETLSNAVTSTIDGMILCSAVPFIIAQRKLLLSPIEKKNMSKRVGTSVAKIVPGMTLSAIVVKQGKKKRQSNVIPKSEDNNEDEEGQDDDDELFDVQQSNSIELSLTPLNLRLEGVHGAYVARLSLSECIEFDPILGTAPRDASKKGVAAFKALNPGSSIQVKVVSVSRIQRDEGDESATPAPKTGKRPRSDSLNRASALYFINVTVRKSDLELPPLHLTYPRVSWPTDFPVYSSSTVYELSEAALSKAGLTSFVRASSLTSASILYADESKATQQLVASASFCAGASGFGVIEGLNEAGTHLLVGLGGSLRGGVSIFEAGDTDVIRDPITGDLHVSLAAATALGARNILKTHSIGSIIPIVVLSVDPTHYHRAELSIRRSRAALTYAASDALSSKKRLTSSLISPYVSITSSVSAWLLDATKRESIKFASPGQVTLCRVSRSDDSFSAALPDDPNRQDLELAPLPSTSTFIRVDLPGGERGVVDITHVSDRAVWKRSQCGRFRDGDVVVGVILGSKSTLEFFTGLNVSFRESFVTTAFESQNSTITTSDIEAPISGKKRKSKDNLNMIPVSSVSASAIRLQELEDEENIAVMAVGTKVSGFIINTSSKGCFVRLSQAVTARVQLSELSDRYVTEPSAAFPPGRLVTGKVISSSIIPNKSSSISHIDLSLKKSVVVGIPVEANNSHKNKTVVASLGFSELTTGDVFDATLTKIADFGLFVALDGTDRFKDENAAKGRAQARIGSKITPISGLVHSSEVFDDEEIPLKKKGGEKSKKRVNLADRFAIGDRLRVIIVEVDVAQKKLSLSVKPSRLLGVQEDEDDVINEEEEEEEEEMENDDNDDDDNDDDDDLDDDLDEGNDIPDNDEDKDEDLDEEYNKGVDDDKDDNTSAQGIFSVLDELKEREIVSGKMNPIKTSETAKSVSLSKKSTDKASVKSLVKANKSLIEPASFGWSNYLESSPGDVDNIDTNIVEKESSSLTGKKQREKLSDRRSLAAIVTEEEETRRLEARLASGEADENPETKEDFERLVLSSPGSSMSWIRYMAWHLSLGEIDAIRLVAERALSTIPYRLETEKLNVWTAWLNLEAQHGTKATLAKVFSQALAAADQRAVYSAMLNVLQKGGDERADECDTLFAIATRKFGSDSITLWIQWATFRFRRGNTNGVSDVLQAANAVLSKDLQIDLTVQFALLQYRFAPGSRSTEHESDDFEKSFGVGSTEVGRSMLEVVLSAAPKRLDVWNVYIDAEIRSAQSISQTRSSNSSIKGVKSKIRLDDLKFIRSLFERVIQLPQSSKKMKFLLKRYATFELEYGDEKGVEHVKKVANDYVLRATEV